MSAILTVRREGDLAVITMDDAKANAFSFEMMDALSAAFAEAKAENLGVVLAGRPGVLSAGLDLKIMKTGLEGAREMLKKGLALYLDIYEHPRPVVIASTGHALAGGAVLLLTGDTRLGCPGDAKIGLTEVAVGLAMPRSVTILARDRLNRAFVSRAILEAEVFSPEGAVAVGYLDRLVPAEKLLEEALAHAQKLAALPKEPYADTKLMLRGKKAAMARKILAEEMLTLKGIRP